MNEETKTQAALQSIIERRNNSAIAITADLANENHNSICRIALAWIGQTQAQSVSYLVKPPTEDFSKSRKVTAAMVADSPSFATVWDQNILPLLKGDVLAFYDAEAMLEILKSSYETSGGSFFLPEMYIRDLHFLALTYLPSLGNVSFLSIVHRLRLSADLDNAASRAVACTCALDRLQHLYPASGYGVPLSMVLAGALRLSVPREPEKPDPDEDEAEPLTLGARLANASRISLIPILCITLCLFAYYGYRHAQAQKNHVDFSSYSTTETLQKEKKPLPNFKLGATYTVQQGTYVVLDDKDISLFIAAAKDRDANKIQAMIQNHRVILFSQVTHIEVTGSTRGNGFVPIKIIEGVYTGKPGFIAFSMIDKPNQ